MKSSKLFALSITATLTHSATAMVEGMYSHYIPAAVFTGFAATCAYAAFWATKPEITSCALPKPSRSDLLKDNHQKPIINPTHDR